jgi:hypothetical protein
MFEIAYHVFLTGLNMASQDGDRSRRIAPFHGLDQTLMFLVRGDPARGIVQAIGPTFEHDALKNMAQGVFQRLVAGKFGDGQMNVLIVDETLAGESVLYVQPICVHLIAELPERGVGERRDGFFHGEGFQRFTELIELFGLLHSNFFAGKTAIR